MTQARDGRAGEAVCTTLNTLAGASWLALFLAREGGVKELAGLKAKQLKEKPAKQSTHTGLSHATGPTFSDANSQSQDNTC